MSPCPTFRANQIKHERLHCFTYHAAWLWILPNARCIWSKCVGRSQSRFPSWNRTHHPEIRGAIEICKMFLLLRRKIGFNRSDFSQGFSLHYQIKCNFEALLGATLISMNQQVLLRPGTPVFLFKPCWRSQSSPCLLMESLHERTLNPLLQFTTLLQFESQEYSWTFSFY